MDRDLAITMFVILNYVNEDINNFVNELKKTKTTLPYKEIKDKLCNIQTRLDFIRGSFKALELKNKNDFIQLGKYLKEVTDELIEIGESN